MKLISTQFLSAINVIELIRFQIFQEIIFGKNSLSDVRIQR